MVAVKKIIDVKYPSLRSYKSTQNLNEANNKDLSSIKYIIKLKEDIQKIKDRIEQEKKISNNEIDEYYNIISKKNNFQNNIIDFSKFKESYKKSYYKYLRGFFYFSILLFSIMILSKKKTESNFNTKKINIDNIIWLKFLIDFQI